MIKSSVNKKSSNKSDLLHKNSNLLSAVTASKVTSLSITTTTTPNPSSLPVKSQKQSNGVSNKQLAIQPQTVQIKSAQHKQPTPQSNQAQSTNQLLQQHLQKQQQHQTQQPLQMQRPVQLAQCVVAPSAADQESKVTSKTFQEASKAILLAQQKGIKRCSPPPDFVRKQMLADQIIVTDVSENNVMITIRECKSQELFFRKPSSLKRKKQIINKIKQQPQQTITAGWLKRPFHVLFQLIHIRL
jgi:hypothetical protein